MRLCLDEHYSPEIAEQLRGRGHDVFSIKERADLVSLPDLELWGHLVAAQCALLTENVADFVPIVRQAAAMGQSHFGLLFTSSKSMPRSRGTIGLFVEKLDELLAANPNEGAFKDRVEWLTA